MRPHITVVLAMSADGKITDKERSPARFGSPHDRSHLEKQISAVDGVLFGAGTLRAYGTTLSITNPTLLQERRSHGKPDQPIHIVCSPSGALDPELRFFRQAVPRWLLTTEEGAQRWRQGEAFEKVLTAPVTEDGVDWAIALELLQQGGLHRIAATGGGELVASLLAIDAIDDLWLTVCPLLLGGAMAPTSVEGKGWREALAPRLSLLSIEQMEDEVFLHYRVVR